MIITWTDENRRHIRKHGGSVAMFEHIMATADQVECEPVGHGDLIRALGYDVQGRRWCAIASYHDDEPEDWMNPITMYPLAEVTS